MTSIQHQAWIASMVQSVEQTMKQYFEREKAEHARLTKQAREAEEARLAKEAEKARIAKAKAEAFACRRCPAKYSSNTKLHEHIRDHHAKKPVQPKSDVSKPASGPPTPTESVASSPPCPKPAPQPKASPPTSPPTPPRSMTSSPDRDTSPKTSVLSGSAPEFVPTRLESASLTPPPTPPQKPASMRPTPPSKTPSKSYLTVDDLYRMFAGKPKPIGLQQHQKPSSSPQSFGTRQPTKRGPIQKLITSYFTLPNAKRSNPEPLHQYMPAEAFRASHIQSPTHSVVSYSSPVCWRCQGPFTTCLPYIGTIPVAGKPGIHTGRRGRRHFRKVWADC